MRNHQRLPPKGHYGFPPTSIVIVQEPSDRNRYPVSGISPPGLEMLIIADHLVVRKTVERLEILSNFEAQSVYVITDSLGQQLFYGAEKARWFMKNFRTRLRPMDIRMVDNRGNQILHFYRPLACRDCCYPCCLQRMLVTLPPGKVIGIVTQIWSVLVPSFVVKNAADDTIFIIRGDISYLRLWWTADFTIYAQDGHTEVGRIVENWSGVVKETFTEEANLTITFPKDLDVAMKATLLGAAYLIYFMYYENNNVKNYSKKMVNM